MPHTRTSPLTAARLRVGTLLGIAILVAVALPNAHVAAQTSPPASSVFYFCYVKGSGTVYRIKVPGVPDDCKGESHTPFSWTDGANALLGGSAAGGDLSGTYPNPSVARIAGVGVSTTAPTADQILKFDGAKWSPATLPAAGGTSDNTPNTLVQRDANGGFAAGALTLSGKIDQTSNNGFVARGTLFQGQIPATGFSQRMMWYPGKAAFRVGDSGGDRWDDANVGFWSMGLGYGTLASASFAVAMGNASVASGAGAFAAGIESSATAEAAIAMGIRSRASGSHSIAMGTFASANNHPGAIVLADSYLPDPFGSFQFFNATADNQFTVRASGGTVIYSAGNLSAGVSLAPGAGAWASVSDVNRKDHFRDVNADTVLARIARMPVREWSYKSQDSTIRHFGPTAQDFYAAFRLDKSDTTITTTDMDGVALLAIQALERRTAELRERTAELRERTAQVSTLEARLAEVERQLALLLSGTASKQSSPDRR